METVAFWNLKWYLFSFHPNVKKVISCLKVLVICPFSPSLANSGGFSLSLESLKRFTSKMLSLHLSFLPSFAPIHPRAWYNLRIIETHKSSPIWCHQYIIWWLENICKPKSQINSKIFSQSQMVGGCDWYQSWRLGDCDAFGTSSFSWIVGPSLNSAEFWSIPELCSSQYEIIN